MCSWGFILGLSGAFLLAPVLLVPIQKIHLHLPAQLPCGCSGLSLSKPSGRHTQYSASAVHRTTAVGAADPGGFGQYLSTERTPLRRKPWPLDSALWSPCLPCCLVPRHLAKRNQHDGLVVAIAFESLLKLLIMMLLGAVIIFQIFDGPAGLNAWLESHQDVIIGMNSHLDDGPWRTTLLMYFASARGDAPYVSYDLCGKSPQTVALHRQLGTPVFPAVAQYLHAPDSLGRTENGQPHVPGIFPPWPSAMPLTTPG